MSEHVFAEALSATITCLHCGKEKLFGVHLLSEIIESRKDSNIINEKVWMNERCLSALLHPSFIVTNISCPISSPAEAGEG